MQLFVGETCLEYCSDHIKIANYVDRISYAGKSIQYFLLFSVILAIVVNVILKLWKNNSLQEFWEKFKNNFFYLMIIANVVGYMLHPAYVLICQGSAIVYYYLFKLFLPNVPWIRKHFLDIKTVKKYMLIFFIIELPSYIYTLWNGVVLKVDLSADLIFEIYIFNAYSYFFIFLPCWIDSKLKGSKSVEQDSELSGSLG
jgi:hypothetical protein